MNTEKLEIIQKNLEELFFILDGFENFGEKVVYWNKQDKCWEYEQYSYYPSIRPGCVKLYIGNNRCTIKQVKSLCEYLEIMKINVKKQVQDSIDAI